jgi:UDP-glucose 4-epimerase
MRYLVTGSSGHLGEALARVLRGRNEDVVTLDVKPGPFTDRVGSITDAAFVDSCMEGVSAVLHTATLHKPHVSTHTRQDFVDVNITGTLNLLEAARRENVSAFVFTSTTRAFGDALMPPPGGPAAWIDEDVVPRPKNIYGVTKLAAEDLCGLFHRKDGLPCIVLRTSRFFAEAQDDPAVRERHCTANSQAVEFLYRRVDIEDAVSAHLLAAEKARETGFARYVISATTPFGASDLQGLRQDAAAVVRRYVDFDGVFSQRGWSMYPALDRVYVNARARRELGWRPVHDFRSVLERVASGGTVLSELAETVGAKGYHDVVFEDGPYPVD